MPENDSQPAVGDQKRTQFEMALCMVLGVVLTAVVAWVLWAQIGITPRRVEMPERLAYAAKWCLVPGAMLLLGLLMVANHRFFTLGADPLSGWSDRWLTIWQRYNQNTLEQAALFVFGVFAFSTITYQYWLKMIPILAMLFAVGRILFVIGYFIRPSYRIVGFVMSFWPLIGLYSLTIYLFWLG